jgi:regulator of nucleoside diphosphate kinase
MTRLRFSGPEASMSNNVDRADAELPPIRMTTWDLWKLDALLKARAGTWSWRVDEILRRELQRSVVMNENQIPPDVATMRSRLEFHVEGAGLARIATLVYPGESHMYEDAMSVLTPFGSAILGLSEGQSISHTGPDGSSMRVTLLRVLRQPETHDWVAPRASTSASLELEPL